jgi:hypothetical protein
MRANPVILPPQYLRTPDAARFLGLSGRTLEKHRTYGTGPAREIRRKACRDIRRSPIGRSGAATTAKPMAANADPAP